MPSNKYLFGIAVRDIPIAHYWQSQYLYITELRSPNKREWGINIITNEVGMRMTDDGSWSDWIAIIATTNEVLDLPSIPQSLVKAYADANGEMKEVDLEMVLHPDCSDCHNFGDEWGIENYIPKIIDNCCVVAESEKIIQFYTTSIQEMTNDKQYHSSTYESQMQQFIDSQSEPQSIQVEPQEQVGEVENIDEIAYAYAKKKKLQIGGIDTWAFVEIFKDGAKWREEHPKETDAVEFAEWIADNGWSERHTHEWENNVTMIAITTKQLYKIFTDEKQRRH